MKRLPVFFFFILLVSSPTKIFALQGEAVLGKPFGVCRIELPLSPAEEKMFSRDSYSYGNYSNGFDAALFEITHQTSVYENNKRALYPAWSVKYLNKSYRKVLLFLFHGTKELNLTLSRTGLEAFNDKTKIKPAENEERYKTLIEEWWNTRLAKLKSLRAIDLYDPSAELGIASIMGRRLNLPLGSLKSMVKNYDTEFERTFGLLLGTESIRLAMQADTMLQTKTESEPSNQRLPKSFPPPAMPIPQFDNGSVRVEPIAMRVPPECFYLRFGSFANFRDTRDFLERWGTVFLSLLSSRSADYGIAKRVEDQLALRQTALSRYFGGSIIKDAAIIGTDTFLREGAAIGILFEAKRDGILKSQLDSIRRDILEENPSVKKSSVTINGRTVSLLSSAGNKVRSFYVQDGGFHLITNSRWIAQVFLETAKTPNKCLGALKEFRYARRQINSFEEGIFIYLSDPFFRNLVSPAYRVEMTRHFKSGAEMRMLSLARIAAMQEGIDSPSVKLLIEKGFLPQGFGTRHDGSRPVLEKDGYAADNKRGHLGYFLPIPDMTIDKITASEAEAYEYFAGSYSGIWTNMDPVFGLLNNKTNSSGERIELKLNISPYAKSRYGDIDQYLGEPSLERMAVISDNIIAVEAQLSKKLVGDFIGYPKRDDGAKARKAQPSLHFFGALRDMDIPWQIRGGELIETDPWGELANRYLQFYAGFVIPPNFNENYLNIFKPVSKTDAQGYTKLRNSIGFGRSNLWSRHFDRYYIISMGRSVLEIVSPNIRAEKAAHPSQLSLNLGDIGKSRLGNFLRAEAYIRERRISAGNALLIHAYEQQLRPDDLNAALKAVQNQNLICPLGGAFVTAGKNQPDRWKSTAWSEEALHRTNKLPNAYRQTVIDAIETMRLEFSIDPNTLKTRLEIQTKAKE